jgi:hypothetical protein
MEHFGGRGICDKMGKVVPKKFLGDCETLGGSGAGIIYKCSTLGNTYFQTRVDYLQDT